MPAQNFVVADAAGDIGWTIAGPIPRRFGFSGRLPRSWADGTVGWDGWLAPQEYPQVINPPSGRIWTANARVVSAQELRKLGDGGYALGARAQQIRNGLATLQSIKEKDLLALQLDDRAVFYQRWRKLLLSVLDTQALAAKPHLRSLRQVVEDWSGRAAIDAIGYRMIREFRATVAQRIAEPLNRLLQDHDPQANLYRLKQGEGPLWRLLLERPEHLLNPRFSHWNELLLDAADSVFKRFTADGKALVDHPWGERNTLRMQHPFSRSMPFLSRWLDMSATPLPGGVHMPRVQGPSNGASQRMVIAPGHEQQAIFHMPGGQSGHPLSPYYRNSHMAWAQGEPSSFLPGVTEHTLELLPAAP